MKYGGSVYELFYQENLTNLQELFDNQIKTLPPEIGKLTNFI